MWFAALSSYRDNGWFMNMMLRIMQGEPSVLGLLQHNPYPTLRLSTCAPAPTSTLSPTPGIVPGGPAKMLELIYQR